ncbi:hypothetical protein BGZ49_003716 [Haplosporangium sp. Z 27]|nr:hypothetical protein BGZ49_003716 [Haplosporangium sp. Z 27]
MEEIIDQHCLYGEEAIAEPITITHKSGSIQFPLNTEDISKVEELLKSCDPSAFGMNKRTVIDTSYRNCKELKPADFTISNNYNEILPRIVAQAANVLESPKPIYASLNKLCVYETHGFFKNHVDTPQSNMFASLVVCLPTSHEGGVLNVEESSYDLSSDTLIKWCAFYSDCEHSIDEVTKGHRMTLTYDLLYIDVPELAPYHDTLYKSLESSLLKLYAEYQVDPETCSSKWPKFVIGIPLASKYPSLRSQGTSEDTQVSPILKGRDLKTLAILQDLGYTTDVKAVYSTYPSTLKKNSYRSSQAFEGVGVIYEEEDEYSADYIEENGDEEVYVISDDWDISVEETDSDIGTSTFTSLYHSGGRCIKNLVWLKEPSCKYAGPSYIAYGNSAAAEFVYMDGCILAYK